MMNKYFEMQDETHNHAMQEEFKLLQDPVSDGDFDLRELCKIPPQ